MKSNTNIIRFHYNARSRLPFGLPHLTSNLFFHHSLPHSSCFKGRLSLSHPPFSKPHKQLPSFSISQQVHTIVIYLSQVDFQSIFLMGSIFFCIQHLLRNDYTAHYVHGMIFFMLSVLGLESQLRYMGLAGIPTFYAVHTVFLIFRPILIYATVFFFFLWVLFPHAFTIEGK